MRKFILGLIGLGSTIIVGCAQPDNDTNPVRTKEQAMSEAHAKSEGPSTDVCAIPYDSDGDGVNDATLIAIGEDGDGDGLAVIPTDWDDIFANNQYACADAVINGTVQVTDETIGLDCLDTDPAVLDAEYTVYVDIDGDGHGDPATGSAVCDASGGVTVGDDCDDTALTGATRYPGNTEACDNVDNDCNGYVDDGLENSWYSADNDGDTYGDPENQVYACSMPSGYVVDATDCDDTVETGYSVNMGMSEECNEIDDNCDGQIDEVFYPDLTSYADAMFDGAEAFYSDEDRDGSPGTWYGFMCASQMESGVEFDYADDCDDADPLRSPLLSEVTGNGIDDDCDAGTSDVAEDPDSDGDLDPDSTDCAPADAAINHSASESCNGVDDDCDGVIDEGVYTPFWRDSDGDGFGDPAVSTPACSASAGWVSDFTDCNDSNSAINTGATEICDTVDNDCDGTVDEGVEKTLYADVDLDGFGDAAVTDTACSASAGWVEDDTDCDDTDGAVNPGETEIASNGVNEDCSVGEVPGDGIDNDNDGVVEGEDVCFTANVSTVPFEVWVDDQSITTDDADWNYPGLGGGFGTACVTIDELTTGHSVKVNAPFNIGDTDSVFGWSDTDYWGWMLDATNITTVSAAGITVTVTATTWYSGSTPMGKDGFFTTPAFPTE